MRSTCGRADLLRVLHNAAPNEAAHLTNLLGFQARPTAPPRALPAEDQSGADIATDAVAPSPTASPETQALAETPFWRLIRREVLADAPPEAVPEAVRDLSAAPPWRAAPQTPPPFDPLVPWPRLFSRLRARLAPPQPIRALDIPRLVDGLARGRLLARLPRQRLRRWGAALQIIEDRSDRLAHLWVDQSDVAQRLARLFPSLAVEYYRYDEALPLPTRRRADGAIEAYRLPGPGATVLACGDLGALARHTTGEVRRWAALGRAIRAHGARPIALLACPAYRWPKALADSWELIAWEGGRSPPAGDADTLGARAERLLGLVASAVRVEPGLLRAVRRLLPGADAGTECDAWQHPAVISQSSVAATLGEADRQRFKQAFEQESQALRKRALQTIRAWRSQLPQAIWFEEALELAAASQALLPATDLEDATRYFQHMARPVWEGQDSDALTPGQRSWLRRVFPRLPSGTLSDRRIAAALHRLWGAISRDEAQPQAPEGLDPARIPPPTHAPPRTLAMAQQANRLVFHDTGAVENPCASPVAAIGTRNGFIHIESRRFWQSEPPPWASDWGTDAYGPWVAFTLAEHPELPAQRLRWIPPGRFVMGSPEGEHGRRNNESPQHEVTLAQGFWLFETACTQALYQAVMGSNPSHFQDPRRPVELVSFQDVQAFLTAINSRLPGLDLCLPSEAQWEYACRAGTVTPFSFGETIRPELANYDGNHPYRESEEKGLYRRETVPVGSLPPNPWGLFEMHGNVWEWVADGWHGNYEGAPTDGSVWEVGEGTLRVIRGGSWFYDGAGLVRCACRNHDSLRNRSDTLGFRCVRVQAGAEPAGSGSRRLAERRRGAARSGGPAVVNVNQATEGAEVALSGLGPCTIRSDREALTLDVLTRPVWASAIGRDRYGLMAALALRSDTPGRFEFVNDSAIKPQPGLVVQRLRWIPPGRFLMGSPEREAGRYDDEGPQHRVSLERGFWLFDTPCTQALYQAVMGKKNPSKFQGADHPVERISWQQATAFIDRLNQGVPGLALSLPSEAQWEYACRAGTQTATYAGDNSTAMLDRIAWHAGNSEGKTHPVAQRQPNAWGLYDMLGNVFEWVADPWHNSYAGAPTDGSVWEGGGPRRVIRGGAWFYDARSVRCAYRARGSLDGRSIYLGFRCARVQA